MSALPEEQQEQHHDPPAGAPPAQLQEGEEQEEHDHQETPAPPATDVVMRNKGKKIHVFGFLRNRNNKALTEELQKTAIVNFVHETLIAKGSCPDHKGRLSKCTCMQGDEMELWMPFLVKYMHQLCFSPVAQREQVQKQFVQLYLSPVAAAESKRPRFPLPSIGRPNLPDDNGTGGAAPPPAVVPLVCHRAMFVFLDVGRIRFATMMDEVKNDNLQPRIHGRKGRKGSRAISDRVDESLHEFFTDLSNLAAPRATRVVRLQLSAGGRGRDSTATGLRDDDNEIQELPTHWTCRQIYARWVETRGYRYELKNNKGAINLEPIAGKEQHDKCVLSTFQAYWKKHFPKLVLPRSREDICNECYVLANKFRYAVTTTSPSTTTNIGGDENDATSSTSTTTNTTSTNNQRLYLCEGTLALAKLHLDRSVAQRLYFNYLQKVAKAHVGGADPREDPNHTVLVMDYCQNMGVPHFGGEQPGATYYFSPLNVFTFGIFNCQEEHLHAYVYHEGLGKKGGNNVASMIYDYLQRRQYLVEQREQQGHKFLSIVMDNCSGQNKNRMVLRMGCYLVERRFFDQVEFVFLVAGHTKNPCDKMFNQLKLTYRKSDVFSFQRLLPVLNTNEAITVVSDFDFHDWDSYFDRIYKRFPSGVVHKSHLFFCSRYVDCGRMMAVCTSAATVDCDQAVSSTTDEAPDDVWYKNFWQTLVSTCISTPTATARRGRSFQLLRMAKKSVSTSTSSTTFTAGEEEEEQEEASTDEETNELTRRDAILRLEFPDKIPEPGISIIKQMELGTKWREYVPEPFRDETCAIPAVEVQERHKLEKQEKRLARNKKNGSGQKKAKKKSPRTTTTTTEEDNENNSEEEEGDDTATTTIPTQEQEQLQPTGALMMGVLPPSQDQRTMGYGVRPPPSSQHHQQHQEEQEHQDAAALLYYHQNPHQFTSDTSGLLLGNMQFDFYRMFQQQQFPDSQTLQLAQQWRHGRQQEQGGGGQHAPDN